MNTTNPSMYEWKDLPWRKMERNVFKLQKRIYRAASRGDVKAVHRLQRLMMKSWSAKHLAVRKVTQENQGKRTAGVDGVKSPTPAQRLNLTTQLNPERKPAPVRRVWIAKPGTSEKRPVGIATVHDRALQTLAKLALEPEWESRFEPNSYGFRPGRSCQDAISAIYLSINKRPKYVLDADIAKCFDRINQDRLVEKLGTFPTLRRLVKAWLQAGVMDEGELFPTTEGVPQGGPISPLLANIALHGLESTILSAFPNRCNRNGKQERWAPAVVRYADDFVVLHPDLTVIEEIQKIASRWLKDMSLELKPSKTHVTHTLDELDGNTGFDFLGFHIQQYPVGKTHTGKSTNGHPLGFKTFIRPSQKAIQNHHQALREVIRRNSNAPQEALIGQLNPLIQGWTQYYASVASSRTFNRMTDHLYSKLRRWANRRHPNWSHKRIAREYWRLETGQWIFATRNGYRLHKHNDTPIFRHVKVRGQKSPYDGDWVYWATRLGRHPEIPKRVSILLQQQQGKCPWCSLYFKEDDVLEVDHILPQSQGGKNAYENWQLLHRHCHDQKTVVDISTVRSTHDKS
jgi:RNA-directed DNA polymerase